MMTNCPLCRCFYQIAVYGKCFNHSARDAWELFQSTGVEALVAYDCSGAVLLMGSVLGGLISGTCAGVWAWIKASDRVVMVGLTSILMGMVLVISLVSYFPMRLDRKKYDLQVHGIEVMFGSPWNGCKGARS